MAGMRASDGMLQSTEPATESYSWVEQMLINAVGYATVLLPGYLALCYFRWSGYLQRTNTGIFFRLIRSCVIGSPADEGDTFGSVKSAELSRRSLVRQCLLIAFCSSGLLCSYLLWGLLQERIMAIEYAGDGGTPERFTNSLFLEFMNRILALLIACFLLLVRRQPTHTAPIYKYSFNALSNVLSSWCQYEALKYVSFPVQVLAKAAKVIPVMLMGRVVSRQTYTVSEYITAAMISAGLFLFVLSTDVGSKHSALVSNTSTVSGVVLLAGYLAFDAFTSNWQGKLFRVYRMSSTQMVAGSNLFSVLFAGVSLIEQGGFVDAIAFMLRHPSFLSHICILSVTSAIGQLFIYFTIAEFGPVTFTIIMTVRQGFAILLSCIMYNHSVGFSGVIGIIVCFAAIFLRTVNSHRHHRAVGRARVPPVITLTRISVARSGTAPGRISLD